LNVSGQAGPHPFTLTHKSATCQNPAVSVNHYENFPVASVLCPPAIRPAVVAIYHFARTADDLADEGDASPSARLADLASYRADLLAICDNRSPSPRWRDMFEALAMQRTQFGLPERLLHDLLDAFEQDVRNPRYTDRPALLDYCRRSANPIGRLLLHLYGVSDATALRQADAVCTALQLINFWQDLSVDGPRGRQYVPLVDLAEHGVTSAELLGCVDSPRSRALVHGLCQWARSLMLQGAPLALRIPGRAGWELRLVVQGGLRILERIERMDHASLVHRPKLSAADLPVLAWRAAWMRRAGA
jgi:hydroxysqualene synthase